MLPSGSIPLFFLQNIPQYRSASDTIQHLPACQFLPGCESFNKPLLPAPTNTRQHQVNTTHGQEKIPIV